MKETNANQRKIMRIPRWYIFLISYFLVKTNRITNSKFSGIVAACDSLWFCYYSEVSIKVMRRVSSYQPTNSPEVKVWESWSRNGKLSGSGNTNMHSESTKVGDLPSNDEKEPEGDCKKKKNQDGQNKSSPKCNKMGEGNPI